MGRRGPAKKPAAIAERDGSAKKNPQRYANTLQAELPVECPAPPDRLSEEARVYWYALAGECHKMGTLATADVEAFADLCEAHARRDLAMRNLEEQGEVIKHDRKGAYRNPWGTVLKEATATLKDLRSKFGLTPSDRANIRVAPKDNEDEGWE